MKKPEISILVSDSAHNILCLHMYEKMFSLTLILRVCAFLKSFRKLLSLPLASNNGPLFAFFDNWKQKYIY